MSVQYHTTFPVGASALTQFQCVKTAAGLVVSAADTDVVLGIIQDGADANAILADVVTFGATKAIASGLIAKGARVCPDAAGKIKAAASGDLVCGVAVTAAALDGDIIDIFFNPSTVVLA